MTTANPLTDCKFCSTISKNNGEDPIGSARFTDYWLVMELPQPWTMERFQTDPVLAPMHDFFHQLHDLHIHVVPMLITPDREYSSPDATRVMFYQKPDAMFAHFEKQEFLIQPEQIKDLAISLFLDREQLSQFDSYRQESNDIRDIMVCTHGNVDVACARFGQPIYQQLRKEYAANSDGKLRVWRCSHFGGHQFAPTLVDLPTGQFWGHLEPEILGNLVNRDRSVSGLRRFYRGWSGLPRLAQFVEREVWMQHGWQWLDYKKIGQVIKQEPEQDSKNVEWAEVKLEYESPDGNDKGAYIAKVELSHTVDTVINSGADVVSVNQYVVSSLERVA
ncbi:Sucraseferredoxin family protein [Thalassoporum mexicanum PCC 7367]|uniref:sucrase ferredoxin n=1 Tax=Thalassoporum mexicanum TaxID=3457544 RepID=UPI00029FA9EE|nr:sucrase ferredoxin [Pseudanabaena sp. PCC 7367]AFY71454.1 Sucraseferredoxin family protein [Pseudanabaena sp. PCC 7367]